MADSPPRIDEETAPRAMLLDDADNVAVAVSELRPGEVLPLAGGAVEVRDRIRFGHKLAVRPIAVAEEITKYGEVIGRATAPIAVGEHVHVQNVVSARLPGPGEGGGHGG